MEKLTDDELMILFSEKFTISKDFKFNRDQIIKELVILNDSEFDECFGSYHIDNIDKAIKDDMRF